MYWGQEGWGKGTGRCIHWVQQGNGQRGVRVLIQGHTGPRGDTQHTWLPLAFSYRAHVAIQEEAEEWMEKEGRREKTTGVVRGREG